MLKILILAVMLAIVMGAVCLAALVMLAAYAVRLLRPVLTGYAKNELHRHYFGRDMPEYQAEEPKRQAKPKGKKACKFCGQNQNAHARTCTACGANLGDAPIVAPPN